MKANETRFPRITRSILRQLDRDQLADVARHGADAGWPGFTYTADTVQFYKSHKADIIEMAKQMADDLGNSMIGMIRNFRCLTNAGKPDYTEDEIAEAIYAGRGESADTIRNAIAWFALEETARELNAEL